MIFKFNQAQLGRGLNAKLNELLADVQKGCETEIVVIPLEFPEKFSIEVGDDIVVVAWDVKDVEYKVLPSPERGPKLESEQDDKFIEDHPKPTALDEKEPEPEPKPQPTLEPELDLSPIVERVEALARALANQSKLLNTEQRLELWMKFCKVLSKELWK